MTDGWVAGIDAGDVGLTGAAARCILLATPAPDTPCLFEDLKVGNSCRLRVVCLRRYLSLERKTLFEGWILRKSTNCTRESLDVSWLNKKPVVTIRYELWDASNIRCDYRQPRGHPLEKRHWESLTV